MEPKTMPPLFQIYKNLILQTSLSLSLTLILTFLKLPVFFFQGLHTYVHPDHVGQNSSQHGVKAAIRRPSSSDSASGLEGYQNLSSKSNVEVKRRNKSKEKFEFDENKAQIFRLKLDDSHLQSRLYFNEYEKSFIFSFLAVSCLLLYTFSDVPGDSGNLANGSLIPVVLTFVAFSKLFMSLAKVSFEKSASRRSEKQLSVLIGVLGSVFGFLICSGNTYSILDFNPGLLDGFGGVFIAVLMGCLAGFLFMPASKSARSLWLGTDQIRCNLSIISCGWFARTILYANYLLTVFTALLWINPFAETIINKNIDDKIGSYANSSVKSAQKLTGNVGLSQSDFDNLRFWCLLLSGLLQIVVLRPNLQMYLNEAVLSWYQRLHASKNPDLDFSRAKVFLHNHYLGLVAVQFFVPPVLVLLFLGLSRVDGDLFQKFHSVCSVLPCSAFVKEVFLFMAWWIVFLLAVLTSGSLLLYRRGLLYIS